MDVAGAAIAGQLYKLCAGLSSDPDGAYELAVSYLSSTSAKGRSSMDERLLCQKIHSKLASISAKDADKFDEYYAKLKSCFILKQRVSVLSLLLALSDVGQPNHSNHTESTQQLFPIPFFLAKSTVGSVTPGSSGTTVSSSSSKQFGAQQWCEPKQGSSDHALPSDPSNIVISLLSDHTNERASVRAAVLAATGVRSRGTVIGSRPAQALFARIAHLGVLNDKLKEFIDPNSGLMPQGLMAEGLVSSIREELTEYHRSVAILQAQACENGGGAATLRRVSVWALEPLHRLTWLANIAHTTHHKKGGELASCVHRFVRHGDERVESLARRLLTALTYPLLLMLTRWLLHGEIEDPFNEFFIESRSNVPIDRMWHDKFRVREWMVPSFMSREQAAQILATGKSVVFMREACDDDGAPPEHARHLQALLKAPESREASEVEGGAWWESEDLAAAVGCAHSAAAARLLSALTSRHHLLDHLAAHKRYLLLAQGDFVHHLMTLLQEELNKPASQLYVHNLTCTLEAAVRATNAQYEPPHVLARLHVNLYPNCDGREDCGWDVFALQYRVDGPLGTLFPATCAAKYRALFTQLWRIKRIEYCLHEAWRNHTILHKRLKNMPEVWSLLRRVSCLRAEALRLCGALQDAAGEGAEPAWVELRTAAAQMKDLDHLLRLHHAALDRHSIHAMIHHTTQELQSYLGNVLNETLALRNFEASLHDGINAELERREDIEKLKAERLARGEYSFTTAEEARDREQRKIFNQFLASRRADLNVWTRTYRTHVTTLILKLALHTEVSLQTLAFRLDYSDFYKRGDAKLHQPLTYQHKRLSEIGLDMAKKKERYYKK